MKNQIALPTETAAEDLLTGLIAECRTIIRDVLVPAARKADPDDCTYCVNNITELMTSAVALSDGSVLNAPRAL